MKLLNLLLVVFLSVVTAFAATQYTLMKTTATPEQQAAKETSFERVIRTGVLRCGYEYWDGAIMRDEKNGQIFGPWADIMFAVAAATGLKVEWTSQVGWGDVGAALKSGKIDAMCAGMWTIATKARQISFSTPLAYQALEAFVRDDDHRFDGQLDKLNDENVKLAVIENDNSDFVATQDFPKAQRVPLSQLNGTDSELMLQVMTGKADATFTVAGQWRQFDKAHPGKIRRLAPEKRLRTYGLAIAVDNDDVRLIELINAAVQEIQNSNLLGQILDNANEKWPDMYIKVPPTF
jgi:ABC-type amino acid transport substrate-binding protein